MSPWSGLNRRKFPRVSYPCLVVVRNQANQSPDVILTHTENVGIGGVCVIIKHDVKVFSTVEVELDLLDLGEHIRCPGKVVWNVQRKGNIPNKALFHDIGIEFEKIPSQDQARLEKLVQRLVAQNKVVPYNP